jgi:hypothetical protein
MLAKLYRRRPTASAAEAAVAVLGAVSGGNRDGRDHDGLDGDEMVEGDVDRGTATVDGAGGLIPSEEDNIVAGSSATDGGTDGAEATPVKQVKPVPGWQRPWSELSGFERSAAGEIGFLDARTWDGDTVGRRITGVLLHRWTQLTELQQLAVATLGLGAVDWMVERAAAADAAAAAADAATIAAAAETSTEGRDGDQESSGGYITNYIVDKILTSDSALDAAGRLGKTMQRIGGITHDTPFPGGMPGRDYELKILPAEPKQSFDLDPTGGVRFQFILDQKPLQPAEALAAICRQNQAQVAATFSEELDGRLEKWNQMSKDTDPEAMLQFLDALLQGAVDLLDDVLLSEDEIRRPTAVIATSLQGFHTWFVGKLAQLQDPGAMALANRLELVRWAAQYEAQLAHYLPRLPTGRLDPSMAVVAAGSVSGFAEESGRLLASWLGRMETERQVDVVGGRPFSSAPADLFHMLWDQLTLATSAGSTELLAATFEEASRQVLDWLGILERNLHDGDEVWGTALPPLERQCCLANDMERCLRQMERLVMHVERELMNSAEMLASASAVGSAMLEQFESLMQAACQHLAADAIIIPLVSDNLPLLRRGTTAWNGQSGMAVLDVALERAIGNLQSKLAPVPTLAFLRWSFRGVINGYMDEHLRGYGFAAGRCATL